MKVALRQITVASGVEIELAVDERVLAYVVDAHGNFVVTIMRTTPA